MTIDVRPAEPKDAEAIVKIRSAYYAARNAPVQERKDVEWWVCELDGRVEAVQSYQDAPDGTRWVLDTYCNTDRYGKMALGALVRSSHDRADKEGVTLMGVTEPDNIQNMKAMEHRGWVLVGFMYARQPKAGA